MFLKKAIDKLENELYDIDTKLVNLNYKINYFERTREYLEDNPSEFYDLFQRLFELTNKCYQVKDKKSNFKDDYATLINNIEGNKDSLKYETLYSKYSKDFENNKTLEIIHIMFICWKEKYGDDISQDSSKEFYNLICYTLNIKKRIAANEIQNFSTIFIHFYSKLAYKYLSDIVEILTIKKCLIKNKLQSIIAKNERIIAISAFILGLVSSILGNIIYDKVFAKDSYKVISNIDKNIEVISKQKPISIDKLEKNIEEIKSLILKSTVESKKTDKK